jgi:hypothetical protein
MSSCKDEARVEQPPRKSGRVAFENGNAVWEWQTATGVFERFISDEKLEQLSAPQLALAEEPALAPRKYEGLWHHDEHRETKPVAARTVRTESKPGAFRGLLRKLSLAY